MEILTVRTSRSETDYCRFGSGSRPFIMIPGVSLRSVLPSADAVAAAYADIASDHTVYLFDRSRDIAPGCGVADMAEDLAAAMETLGLDGADVLGCSQGGMIALCLAAAHPTLVRRQVLASAMLRPTPTCRAVFDCWRRLVREGNVTALNRDVFGRIYSEEYLRRYADAFRALEGEGTPEEMRRFGLLVDACLTYDGTDAAKRVTCPTLVIGADNDRTLGGEASRELADAIGCPAVIYPGQSHAVYDEEPDCKVRLAEFFRAP